MVKRHRVEREIERLRSTMEQEAERLGLYHPSVIHISQELDKLHNEWNRLQQGEEKDVYIIRRYTSKIREAIVGSEIAPSAGRQSGCVSSVVSV